MKAKRSLAIALCLVLMCGLCVPTALAAGYNDTAGHWAESSIERWSGYNIVEGYDGSFSPDDSLTRGQMAKILATTLGLTETAGNPFTDVPADAWYAPYVLRCYAAGIILGDGAKANPDSYVTRQETMVMFCRALDIAPAEGADLSSYADGGSVADWAAPYMAAVTRAGIITGVGGNQIAPLGDMTRAAFMTVLDRAVVQYINAPGSYELTNKSGIILVAAGDVTLSGTTSADILVTPAASGKSVGFEKANVTGSVTVKADNAKVTSTDSNLPEIVQNGTGITVEEGGAKENTPSAGTNSSSGGGGGGGTSGGGSNTPTPTPAPTETATPTASPEPSTSPESLEITKGGTSVTEGTYTSVTITEGVGNDTVTLSDITIEGDLTIEGGGSNSINLTNVTIIGKIIMNKATGDGKQPPRLVLENTPVENVEVQKPAIIEAGDERSEVKALKAEGTVEIRGEKTGVTALTVPAHTGDAVEVNVKGGKVDTVTAEGAATIKGTGGTVEKVTAEAKVEINSTGTEVKTVTVSSKDESTVVEVKVTSGTVEAVEAKSAAKITGTGGTVSSVEAEANVEIDSDGTKVGTVTVPASTEGDEDAAAVEVTVTKGTVNTVEANSATTVKVKDGTVEKVEANSATTVTAESDATGKVEAVEAKADVTVDSAVVEKVEIPESAPDVKIEVEGTGKVEVDVESSNKVDITTETDEDGKKATVDVSAGENVTPNVTVDGDEVEHIHKWGPWTNNTTDAETAETHSRTCSAANCTEPNSTQTVDHNYGDWSSDGATGHSRTCKDCAHEDTETHTEVNIDPVPPTCTEPGSKDGKKCSVCGAITTEPVTDPATGHKWTTEGEGEGWSKKDGEFHTRECSVCFTQETEAHEWGEWEENTEDNTRTRTCSKCNAEETETLAKTKITLAETQEEGFTMYTASWTPVDGVNDYILKILDSEGEPTSTGSVLVEETTSFEDLLGLLPPLDTGTATYSIALYDEEGAEELGRLDNAIVVTVGGSAVKYTIQYNVDEPDAEGPVHVAFCEDQTAAKWIFGIWYRGDKVINLGSCSPDAEGVPSLCSLEKGDVYDLRFVTSSELAGQTLKATITPPSKTTYTGEEEPPAADTDTSNVWFKEENGSLYIYINTSDYPDAIYKLNSSYTITGTGTDVRSMSLMSYIADKLYGAVDSFSEDIEITVGVPVEEGSGYETKPLYTVKDGIKVNLLEDEPQIKLVQGENGTYTVVNESDSDFDGLYVFKVFDGDDAEVRGVNTTTARPNASLTISPALADGYKVKMAAYTWTLTPDEEGKSPNIVFNVTKTVEVTIIPYDASEDQP